MRALFSYLRIPKDLLTRTSARALHLQIAMSPCQKTVIIAQLALPRCVFFAFSGPETRLGRNPIPGVGLKAAGWGHVRSELLRGVRRAEKAPSKRQARASGRAQSRGPEPARRAEELELVCQGIQVIQDIPREQTKRLTTTMTAFTATPRYPKARGVGRNREQ